MSKRITIGRTLPQRNAASVDENTDSQTATFSLASGKKAVFALEVIPAEMVEEKTFVEQDTNGRDQSALTPESLKDITSSFKLQQFYPAIGIRHEDKIEIIDGSRRRASAIICKAPLSVLVSDSVITASDARELAKAIQTAREHNLREIGFRLMALKDSGMSQKDIASLEGMSQAKVTRALQAASAPASLISVFPVQDELTFSDYKALLSVFETLSGNGSSVEELLIQVQPQIAAVYADKALTAEEAKNKLLLTLKKACDKLLTPQTKDKALVTTLIEFEDKDRYARKRVKGRSFSYEFNRLSKEVQDELDEAIKRVLSNHK